MTFPARSIIGLAACGGGCGTEQCGAIRITCDCGTQTHLALDVSGHGKAEAAFTCDGCQSVTWFTVTA